MIVRNLRMPVKREPCRNFQRGSCKYGAQCKFLHVTQQQQQPNIFGFGSQAGSAFNHRTSEQEKPNPFGFGVKNNIQSKGTTDSGSRQNQFKPFENTWSRFSPLTTGSSTPSRQSSNQQQGTNHDCADPESCKRQIIEDLLHERPLWKLTCYGHVKNAPCDIGGDVSYEELRAVAYDDAKRGLSLPSIVARERSLVNAKLIEFDNLQRSPYLRIPQSPFLEATQSVSPLSSKGGVPPTVSGFGQSGATLNTGFGLSASASTASDNAFKQSNPIQAPSQTSSAFGAKNSPFGGFQSKPASQTTGKSFAPSTWTFGSKDPFANTPPLSSVASMAFPNSVSNEPHTFPSIPDSVLTGVGNSSTNGDLVEDLERRNVPVDDRIWLKEKWCLGEIPEMPPPDAFVK